MVIEAFSGDAVEAVAVGAGDEEWVGHGRSSECLGCLKLIWSRALRLSRQQNRAGTVMLTYSGETNGVAVCNQVLGFDIEQRVRDGSARFIERLDDVTMADIVARVVSAIDPLD
ncbi:MAG: hypothetical protein ABWZ65_24090 [Pseudomonas mandelii]